MSGGIGSGGIGIIGGVEGMRVAIFLFLVGVGWVLGKRRFSVFFLLLGLFLGLRSTDYAGLARLQGFGLG